MESASYHAAVKGRRAEHHTPEQVLGEGPLMSQTPSKGYSFAL